MRVNVIISIISGCLLLFLVVGNALSQIPQTLSYQGILTDAEGNVVPDGNYRLTFRLYSSPENSALLWEESQDIVSVQTGVFNVILGSITPLDLPFDQPYFFAIAINDGEELSPRIELTSSAYSLNARSVADSAVTGKKIADGQVVRALKVLALDGSRIATLTDSVKLRAGSNISLDVDGFTGEVLISASGQVAESRNTLDAADGDPVDAVFVDDAGNVGIGTTSPDVKLHVAGSVVIENSGRVGIGTNLPNTDLHIFEDRNGIVGIKIENPNTGGASKERITFENEDGGIAGIQVSDDDASTGSASAMSIFNNRPAGSIRFSTNGQRKMTVANNGNVGIGTTSPGSLLHLEKDAGGLGIISLLKLDPNSTTNNDGVAIDFVSSTVEDAIGGRIAVQRIEGGANADMAFSTRGSAVLTERMRITKDGNVGIGTATPSEILHLNTPSDTDMKMLFSEGGSPAASLFYEGSAGFGTNNLLHLRSEIGSKANMMTWKLNGNVGIGISDPTEKLHVNGNALADAHTTPSSRRWKTNIETITNPLEKVQRLRGVSYDWKESGKHDIGLIAEEVGEVIPEIVAYEENGIDAKSVDYSRLVAVLIEGMKEQQKLIDELSTRISKFESTIIHATLQQ